MAIRTKKAGVFGRVLRLLGACCFFVVAASSPDTGSVAEADVSSSGAGSDGADAAEAGTQAETTDKLAFIRRELSDWARRLEQEADVFVRETSPAGVLGERGRESGALNAGKDREAAADPGARIRTSMQMLRRRIEKIRAWENEARPVGQRLQDVAGCARACAVEHENRRELQAALKQAARGLEQWLLEEIDIRRARRIRLGKLAALLDGESTAALDTALQELGALKSDLGRQEAETVRSDSVSLRHSPFSGGPDGTDGPSVLEQICTAIGEIRQVLRQSDEWDRRQAEDSVRGRARQLLRRAESYGPEKEMRQTLQKTAQELDRDLFGWTRALQARRHADLRTLDRMAAALQTLAAREAKSGTVAESDPVAMDRENIEYFELRQAGSLKEISALPEIYGDASQWRLLYTANPRVARDGDHAVPAGTVLVVPRTRFVEQ